MNIGPVSSHLHFTTSRPSQERAQPASGPGSSQQTQDADKSPTGTQAPESSSREDAAKPQQDELREIRQLKIRDREVRAHEAAHMAAGGSLVRSGARLDMKRGPDGVMYAVGGEVSIDVSPGSTPEETVGKAEQIRRAALAPAEPSGQDRAVAARAAQMAAKARMQVAQQQRVANGAEDQPANSNAINQYLQIGSLESPEQTSIDDTF
ncbi:putative metalloprotease CJM1_0395 family protein [Pseudomonadota bacterium]